jgi:hypothetical protein
LTNHKKYDIIYIEIKKGGHNMTYFIPASFNDEDYAPSWTGNYTYPTVTIRGIFDSYEKAKESIKGWRFADDCVIITRELGDDNEIIESFDISYEEKYFDIWRDEIYKLNEIVDEEYSAVYDEFQDLGVTDY